MLEVALTTTLWKFLCQGVKENLRKFCKSDCEKQKDGIGCWCQGQNI